MFVAKRDGNDSDYSSAELFIAAYLRRQAVTVCIEQGYDLHSYSSFLIFGQKWLDAGGSAEPVGKPPTKEAADPEKSKTFRSLYFTVPE
jgi:hypothetical protein